jgi:hypothetical protein
MMELTGTVKVAERPEVAWRLFTPEGEKDWAAGWAPRYPAPSDDDSAPGTVFETGGDHPHHPAATWVVVTREPGRRMSYTRVVAGHNAGTVTVELAGDDHGHTTATVTYRLTALTEAGREHLATFAAGYQDYLLEWQEAIGRVTG